MKLIKETVDFLIEKERELDRAIETGKNESSAMIRERQKELYSQTESLKREQEEKFNKELKNYDSTVELEIRKYLSMEDEDRRKISFFARERIEKLICDEEERFKSLEWLLSH